MKIVREKFYPHSIEYHLLSHNPKHEYPPKYYYHLDKDIEYYAIQCTYQKEYTNKYHKALKSILHTLSTQKDIIRISHHNTSQQPHKHRKRNQRKDLYIYLDESKVYETIDITFMLSIKKIKI